MAEFCCGSNESSIYSWEFSGEADVLSRWSKRATVGDAWEERSKVVVEEGSTSQREVACASIETHEGSWK